MGDDHEGEAAIAPERDPFDLAILAEQVLLTRESQARARSIDLRSVLAPAPVAGDPRLVERLIANLADNALAYNSSPGRIEVTTGRRGGAALLSVTNAGPVVDAGAVGRLTQPFERLAPERTGHGEGSGLGLSIVQAIVSAHEGSLTIRARRQGGLTVEVTFASPGAADHEGPRPAQSSAPTDPLARASEAVIFSDLCRRRPPGSCAGVMKRHCH